MSRMVDIRGDKAWLFLNEFLCFQKNFAYPVGNLRPLENILVIKFDGSL